MYAIVVVAQSYYVRCGKPSRFLVAFPMSLPVSSFAPAKRCQYSCLAGDYDGDTVNIVANPNIIDKL
eukprot:3595909-Amphidinium_carterae.1